MGEIGRQVGFLPIMPSEIKLNRKGLPAFAADIDLVILAAEFLYLTVLPKAAMRADNRRMACLIDKNFFFFVHWLIDPRLLFI